MEVRIDKWLWMVRLFKTRSQACEACQGGNIKIGGVSVKPSKVLSGGELITVKIDILEKNIKVIDTPKNRIGAVLVSQYYEDLTTEEEYERVRLLRTTVEKRDHGLGRPTKRDR